MELWYTEYQTPNVGITCKVSKSYLKEKTPFQEIAVIDTEQFGKMLVLDGAVQTTDVDEFIYHEMITHVSLSTHPNPKKALVVGGGDGGAIREILKHPSIEKAVLVEIDRRVVEVGKEYFPKISCKLNDSKVEVIIDDGIKYIREHKNEFDFICIDSTDPVGPAVGLFSLEFYKSIFESLKEDGVFVAQTESPFYHKELIKNVFNDVKSVFPITRFYLANVPTYPSGIISFTIGSKKYDPLLVDITTIPELDTKYYCPNIHKSVFCLPKFMEELIK